jgi:light-regulated signal transduction histidine kinase (bacteriophytochrome)
MKSYAKIPGPVVKELIKSLESQPPYKHYRQLARKLRNAIREVTGKRMENLDALPNLELIGPDTEEWGPEPENDNN